jgi:hypothetical protein
MCGDLCFPRLGRRFKATPATTGSAVGNHEAKFAIYEFSLFTSNNVRSMTRRIVGLATTVVLSVGLGLAGLGLAAVTAQAEPGFALSHAPIPAARGPYQWCPGQPLPTTDVVWDMNVCHTWYWVDYSFQANRGQFVYEGDNPPPNLGCIPLLCLPGL